MHERALPCVSGVAFCVPGTSGLTVPSVSKQRGEPQCGSQFLAQAVTASRPSRRRKPCVPGHVVHRLGHGFHGRGCKAGRRRAASSCQCPWPGILPSPIPLSRPESLVPVLAAISSHAFRLSSVDGFLSSVSLAALAGLISHSVAGSRASCMSVTTAAVWCLLPPNQLCGFGGFRPCLSFLHACHHCLCSWR